jgi:hypothetical protein
VYLVGQPLVVDLFVTCCCSASVRPPGAQRRHAPERKAPCCSLRCSHTQRYINIHMHTHSYMHTLYTQRACRSRRANHICAFPLFLCWSRLSAMLTTSPNRKIKMHRHLVSLGHSPSTSPRPCSPVAAAPWASCGTVCPSHSLLGQGLAEGTHPVV